MRLWKCDGGHISVCHKIWIYGINKYYIYIHATILLIQMKDINGRLTETSWWRDVKKNWFVVNSDFTTIFNLWWQSNDREEKTICIFSPIYMELRNLGQNIQSSCVCVCVMMFCIIIINVSICKKLQQRYSILWWKYTSKKRADTMKLAMCPCSYFFWLVQHTYFY